MIDYKVFYEWLTKVTICEIFLYSTVNSQISQCKGRSPAPPHITSMFQPLRKTHPLLKIANGSLIDLPSPANISTWWNFGSLLGICLGVQIVTGLFLAMHYVAHIDYAFASVVIIWFKLYFCICRAWRRLNKLGETSQLVNNSTLNFIVPNSS